MSDPLVVKDLLNAGVWMVRLAGRRRLGFGGIWIGEGGAERWCFEVVSTRDAVAIGGREFDDAGMRRDKFFRLRARRPGEFERRLAGAGSSLELSGCIVGRGATSRGRTGGMNLG